MSSLPRFAAILIDDDIITNYLNEILLLGSGSFIPSLIFHDSTQALHYLEQNYFEVKNRSVKTLFLIDINMPVVNGFELIQKIKRACPDLLEQAIVCILSTSGHEEDTRQAQKLRIDLYLQKPLTNAKIRLLVELLEKNHC